MPCATDIILHLGFIRRGFDKFDGYWIGSEDYFKHTRRSRTYPKVAGFDFHHNEDPDFRVIGKYSSGMFADKATAIIRRALTKSSPLFLYLAFQAPHSPLQVEEIEKENCKMTQVAGKVNTYLHHYSSKNQDRKIYCGMVTALDSALGRIVNTLEETKMMNNALIVFTTDNGGNVQAGGNNYPLRGGKVLIRFDI